jgi:hypothetical protein
LIGFLGSGYLCWVILLVYYLVAYKPHEAGFSRHVNPIDAWILDWFRKYIGDYSYKWGAGLEKVRRMKRFFFVSLSLSSRVGNFAG